MCWQRSAASCDQLAYENDSVRDLSDVTGDKAAALAEERKTIDKLLDEALTGARQGLSKRAIERLAKIFKTYRSAQYGIGLHPPAKAPPIEFKMKDGCPDSWHDGYRS